MKGYITRDGVYYEATSALSGEDKTVPLRPSPFYHFDHSQHEWIPHRRSDHPAIANGRIPEWPARMSADRHSADREPRHSLTGSKMRAEDIRLTLKDAIQITFAVVSIVSVYYALRQDIVALQYEVTTLREHVTLLQHKVDEHANAETAHWRQFKEVKDDARELETTLADIRRQSQTNR